MGQGRPIMRGAQERFNSCITLIGVHSTMHLLQLLHNPYYLPSGLAFHEMLTSYQLDEKFSPSKVYILLKNVVFISFLVSIVLIWCSVYNPTSYVLEDLH